jgi:hypothetical protein
MNTEKLSNEAVNPPLSKGVVMPRFVLMGFEFNDLWKVPDLFSHENEDGILMTVDEWDKAEKFETMELAEYKRQYLQVNYNDYTWYVVRLNEA